MSSFGSIPYGHKIEGRLLFDITNQLGCDSFNFEAKENPLVGESPFIMVFEGECSLIDKVKNIEKSGGHLAIIINRNDDNIGGIFMNDDGVGYDISIPAILISNSDGKKLVAYYLEYLNSHEEINEIKLEVKFENENLDNTVKYDLWYSPDQDNAYTFLIDFKEIQKSLIDNAILGIHFFTYPHYNYRPDNELDVYGYPSGRGGLIGSFSGFLRSSCVQLADGFVGSVQERNEILQMIAKGIYI